MNLSELNRTHIDSFTLEQWANYYSELSAECQALNRWMVAAEDGHLVVPYPVPLLFPWEMYQRLQRATEVLVEVQHKILRRLLRQLERPALLDLFRLPRYLERFIDWQRLEREAPWLGRFDIIIADQVRPLFCEFNIDSSIGGGDAFAYAQWAARRFPELLPSRHHLDSFYESLTNRLIRMARAHHKTEIGLFIWHTWLHRGGYNCQYWMNLVREQGFPVSKVTDLDFKRRTTQVEDKLMYRVLAKEHMVDDLELMAELFRRGMLLVSDFGDELYCSKVWFGLFFDDAFTSGLSQREKQIIAEYLPVSHLVNDENLDHLLGEKDRWIFKPTDAYGGKGILIGEERSREAIASAILAQYDQGWIAQEYVKDTTILLPRDADRTYQRYHAVFGLYKVGDEYSGISVRLSQATKIVNLSGGKAQVGWAVPVEP